MQNGNVCGQDAKGQLVRIGDVVCHTEKGLVNGVVRDGGYEYKGEPAVIVDYPGAAGWKNRLSKLTVGGKVVPKTLGDYGYKVGDVLGHVKYPGTYTIDSEKIGEYRGEPCCYTNNGRATRFSQLRPIPVSVPVPDPDPTPCPSTCQYFWDEILKNNIPDGYEEYDFELKDGRTLTIVIE
jgi:hypothetical protein